MVVINRRRHARPERSSTWSAHLAVGLADLDQHVGGHEVHRKLREQPAEPIAAMFGRLGLVGAELLRTGQWLLAVVWTPGHLFAPESRGSSHRQSRL